MNPADLSRTVVRAVRCAVEDGELGADVAVPGRVVVERTRPGGVGEYATPVAFQVAKAAGRAPGEVARVLARRLGQEPGIESVEVTGPGFLNFVLPAPSAPLVIRDVLVLEGAAFLPVDIGAGLGLRERVVRESVLRLVRSQGGSEHDVTDGLSVAPLAKRDGDVVARFGVDAARWAMLCVPARETPEFSDRLLLQGEGSEFFRVRYAHARSRALLSNADGLGFGPAVGEVDAPALLRALAGHPLVLEAAAHHRAPERLTRHLVELADALLDFQYRVLPQGDEKPSAAHRARLALAEAAGTVLAGGLALLGIDAPTRL
ncbi:ArgS-related anticodon-binding protein NrtL [Streptomyces sp. NBC_00162]|uniref:ArgS-related anticodon-binding protein NrtL n=1 Tax=Streptomyces sp. NBC_00162 TaxID=2903629 RepID=UPI00214BACE7|nr:DALR anticodon-binding domain-containing protein [Streptomyces sp. NBC_00162]UUU39979.1 DALR anticodon-binding domain-containing protein [Streptomyces sp. NBC_00162]